MPDGSMTAEQVKKMREVVASTKSTIAFGDVDTGHGPIFLRGWNACLEFVEKQFEKHTS